MQTFEFEGAPGHVSLETLTFEEHGDTTVIRANSVYQSVADRDAMIASGMESGLNEGYERLDELLPRTDCGGLTLTVPGSPARDGKGGRNLLRGNGRIDPATPADPLALWPGSMSQRARPDLAVSQVISVRHVGAPSAATPRLQPANGGYGSSSASMERQRIMPTTTSSDIETTRLNRRNLLGRSAVGIAIPAARVVAGLPVQTAATQSTGVAAAASVGRRRDDRHPSRRLRAGQWAADVLRDPRRGRTAAVAPRRLRLIELWGPILATLAENHQVIAVEFQGHGRTADIDRPLTYEQLVEDTAALMRHLDIEQA